MEPDNALILSNNVIVAHQIACLLGNLNLNVRVVYNRMDAYAALDRSTTGESDRIGVLVTDIETPELEGNTIAGWYRAVTPNVSWYAICSPDCQDTPMLIAQAQKVDGLFYLNHTGHSLDPNLGLTREILSIRPAPKKAWNMPSLLPAPSGWFDSGLIAGA
ncbi:MAG TPA: hypothetical protein VJ961_09915 [Mariprofundaceae bacterium]|nr:hypothetical protein [Mariprofundaceae bacterium]